MQIDYYWQRRRRRILGWMVATFIGLPLMLVSAKLILPIALASVIDELLSPERSARLQVIATLGNLLIGTVLVVVTSVYAWITRATLYELTETRRAARRPTPLVVARAPQIARREGRRTEFSTELELTNAGVGAAVRPVITIILPSGAPAAPNDKWLAPPAWKTSTDIRDLPTLLASGTQIQRRVTVLLEPFEIPMERLKGFMQAFLVFEDADRNLYQLMQEYDLLLHADVYTGWILIYERLTMQPVQVRDAVADDHGASEWMSEGKTQRIYERAGLP